MAIHLLKGFPVTALVGKFICSPSLLSEQDYGFPAVIEKVSAAQLSYRRLPRGAWDSVEKEWQVLPVVGQVGECDTEGPRKCKMTSIKFVCDSPVEAIALYAQATATRKAIERFRQEQLANLDAQAGQGLLPVPCYLVDQAKLA